jgi:hypothetical protein
VRCARALLAAGVVLATLSGIRHDAAAGSRCDVRVGPRDDIQSLIDRRPDGTTFCFRAGMYRLSEPIHPDRGDRLIAIGRAVLNGAKVVRSFDRVGDRWVARNQTQQSPLGGETCMPSGYRGCQYAEGVFIDDRALRQVTSLEQLRPGTFYFDYEDDAIYLADDPTGHTVEASVTPAAIVGYVDVHDDVTVQGFRIEKFTNAHHVMTAAIKPGARWRIIGNEIRLNHRMAVALVSGTVIRRNRIHHNGAAGMKGSGAGILIEDNVIAHNNIGAFSLAYSGGARFTHASDLVVRGNRVLRNATFGLKTDTDNVDVLFEENTIVGNAGCGIVHEVSYDAVIRGNVVKNNCRDAVDGSLGQGANIMVLSSPRVLIEGNVVVSGIAVNGIGLLDASRGSGPHGVYEIRDVRVIGNVVKMVRGAETGLVGGDAGVYTSRGNRFAGNTYYLRGTKSSYWRWDDLLGRTEWQATGNDVNGTFRRWERG